MMQGPTRRLLELAGLAGCGLVVACGAWLGYDSFRGFSNSLEGVGGVTLSDDRAAVRRRLGPPDHVSDTATADALLSAPAGSLDAYRSWIYRDKGLTVAFRPDGRIERIACTMMFTWTLRNAARPTCEPVAGVALETGEDDLVRKLGAPTATDIRVGSKTLAYARIGAAFDLEKGVVVSYGLENKERSFWDRFRQWIGFG